MNDRVYPNEDIYTLEFCKINCRFWEIWIDKLSIKFCVFLLFFWYTFFLSQTVSSKIYQFFFVSLKLYTHYSELFEVNLAATMAKKNLFMYLFFFSNTWFFYFIYSLRACEAFFIHNNCIYAATRMRSIKRPQNFLFNCIYAATRMRSIKRE